MEIIYLASPSLSVSQGCEDILRYIDERIARLEEELSPSRATRDVIAEINPEIPSQTRRAFPHC